MTTAAEPQRLPVKVSGKRCILGAKYKWFWFVHFFLYILRVSWQRRWTELTFFHSSFLSIQQHNADPRDLLQPWRSALAFYFQWARALRKTVTSALWFHFLVFSYAYLANTWNVEEDRRRQKGEFPAPLIKHIVCRTQGVNSSSRHYKAISAHAGRRLT